MTIFSGPSFPRRSRRSRLSGSRARNRSVTVALLTLNSVLIPPPASPAGRMEVYKTTYFPAVTTAGAATTIAVEAGEERTDLRIGLRPVPAVKISGRLVTPDGSRAAADVASTGW